MKTCNTCNKMISGAKTEFKCPDCGKSTIVRCEHCKRTAKTYTCSECGFQGP